MRQNILLALVIIFYYNNASAIENSNPKNIIIEAFQAIETIRTDTTPEVLSQVIADEATQIANATLAYMMKSSVHSINTKTLYNIAYKEINVAIKNPAKLAGSALVNIVLDVIIEGISEQIGKSVSGNYASIAAQESMRFALKEMAIAATSNSTAELFVSQSLLLIDVLNKDINAVKEAGNAYNQKELSARRLEATNTMFEFLKPAVKIQSNEDKDKILINATKEVYVLISKYPAFRDMYLEKLTKFYHDVDLIRANKYNVVEQYINNGSGSALSDYLNDYFTPSERDKYLARFQDKWYPNIQSPKPKDENNTGTTSDTITNKGTATQDKNTGNLTQSDTNKFSLSGNMSLITHLGNFVYGSATSASAFDKTSVKTFSDITKSGNDVLIKIYNNNQYLTTILANPINNNNLSSYTDNTNSNTVKATLETKGADNYNYSYLAWGEWNGKANLAFTNPSNGQQSNITHGQYIAGIPAENNLPKGGTAHYTGNIQGDFTPNNSFATEKNTIGGTVSMDANFNGNPTISGDINATHNGNQFGHGHFDNLAIDKQSATFHSNFNNNVNGGVGGTFYGNGDEMGGGGFMYNNLGNASYVFEAHKQ